MVWQFLQRLSTELPNDPEILLLRIDPREMETCPYEHLYADVHSSIAHRSQKVKATPN